MVLGKARSFDMSHKHHTHNNGRDDETFIYAPRIKDGGSLGPAVRGDGGTCAFDKLKEARHGSISKYFD